MEHNYKRIIEVLLGVLFATIILGYGMSIAFLDYEMGYYGQEQEFANLILTNDKYLIAFTTVSIACCILYAAFDFWQVKYHKFIQFVLSIVLMGIASYLLIIMVSLRKQAFSIDGYSLNSAFSLYKEYRTFSVLITSSQFIISIYGLINSFYVYFKAKNKENHQESDDETIK